MATSSPSLWRPSLYSLTFIGATVGGLGLVGWAMWELGLQDWLAMGPPILMMVLVVVTSELRPMVMARVTGNPISLSLAFVFATMYVWGVYPALVLQAGAVLLGEVLLRKPVWKAAFNVGQYSLSLMAAWAVMVLVDVRPTALSPHEGLSVWDLGWIACTWLVFHLVNLALVAGLAADEGITWLESFTEEFWFYSGSALAVLAVSPLIAVVAAPELSSWTLLPLLLLPLVAVQRATEMRLEREHLELHDRLTGLPNRILLADRIEHSLHRSGRPSGQVVLLFLDLDLFKVINDSLGHAAGDALLVQVSQRLGQGLRAADTLARFGGDEFAVVCDNVPEDELDVIAERVREILREPFTFEGRRVTLSASIGVTRSGPSSTAETLMRDADAAMHRAKAAGRDRIAFFHQDMNQQDAARLQTEVELRIALERGQLRAHYQPVVSLDSGRVVGVEALMRWEHPQFGLIGPSRFIPLAEETGLIVRLGNWILDQSVDQLARWRAIGLDPALWVSVNLSARQLQSPDCVAQIAHSLKSHGVPAANVHLEITESVIMSNFDDAIGRLQELRDLGVALSIDDFGTGYSSLSYLRDLPVSILKVDQSFVAGLEPQIGRSDADDRDTDLPIVKAVVSLARSLGLEVVAEGVETVGQMQVLRSLGVDSGQGYLWSPPLAPEGIPSFVADLNRGHRRVPVPKPRPEPAAAGLPAIQELN